MPSSVAGSGSNTSGATRRCGHTSSLSSTCKCVCGGGEEGGCVEVTRVGGCVGNVCWGGCVEVKRVGKGSDQGLD
eukprot:359663-Chlamydomonas_euryale.AAC.2